jgi:hypothetical protein
MNGHRHHVAWTTSYQVTTVIGQTSNNFGFSIVTLSIVLLFYRPFPPVWLFIRVFLAEHCERVRYAPYVCWLSQDELCSEEDEADDDNE